MFLKIGRVDFKSNQPGSDHCMLHWSLPDCLFVSHRMQRKDDDTGRTDYYCKQLQCQHARSQLHKQTLFEEERRPDEVIAEPLPQLQCIAPRQCRHCVPAKRRSALAFCTKWNYCCGLDVEAFSTVLHCWLRPCPRQDHLQLGCSEV